MAEQLVGGVVVARWRVGTPGIPLDRAPGKIARCAQW
jgi:hypothetical protein